MKKGIIAILATAAGGAIGATVVKKKDEKKINWQKKRIDKFYNYFQLVNQWLALKNEGKSLTAYFEKNGYQTIAIYGIGELGNRLVEELKNSDITIKYTIDRKQDAANTDLRVLSIEEAAEEAVDVIIVTPIFAYDELEATLMEQLDYPVVSLEDVVYSI